MFTTPIRVVACWIVYGWPTPAGPRTPAHPIEPLGPSRAGVWS